VTNEQLVDALKKKADNEDLKLYDDNFKN